MKVGMKRMLPLLLAVLLVIPQVPLRTYGAEENPAEAGQSVTVTFAVGEEAYTNDPGSGQIHITADEPVTGGELVYTPWAGRYKVTGTGTLCSFTIPAGTSLEQNGIALPKLNVTNIGTENTNTYLSSYSWADSRGMICNEDTVFSENTTLSVALYGDGESYSLKFVCGGGDCSGQHSIPYILGGYPSATLRVGQSVSAPYIPGAQNIDANYSSEYCTHGKDYGELFVKWQVKNSASGEMVDFTAGTPITADYAENGSHSIKVYAVWGESVTATFRNSYGIVKEIQIAQGATLGELPEVEVPEGFVFLGWEYTDEQGIVHLADEETAIAQDTVFSARIVPKQSCSVTFYDVRPNGTSRTITAQVQVGQTLAQAIDVAGESQWIDGIPLADCVWYTQNDQGEKLPQTLNTPITQDAAFYTYTYQLELTFDSEVQSALTVTGREGQPLSPSDFVAGGVDYCTYTWTTEQGTTLNFSQLFTAGLTENISATTTRTEQKTGQIRFFVAIDNEWVPLSDRKMTIYTADNGRYNLTATQLESIYGEFGFTADMLQAETTFFPHTSPGDETIWGDVAAKIYLGIVYSPLRGVDYINSDVYYLPSQNCTNNGEKANYAESNSFYTVQVQDPAHQIYPDGELPAISYTYRNETAVATVKTASGVQWQCVGQDGSEVPGTENPDGTVTFTIANILQPYVISPVLQESQILLTYDIHLPKIPSDEDYGAPTIGGQSVYTTVGEGGKTHTILAPSMTEYFYDSGKYVGEATFQGWAVNGNSQQIVQPGESYTVPADATEITFVAQWSTKLGGTTAPMQSTMVNFFVALTAVPEGGTSWVGSTETNFFTGSVFTTDCGVLGQTAVEQKLYRETMFNDSEFKQYIVGGATSGNNLNAIHSALVQTLTAGYTMEGANGEKYTYRLQFPTDEEVLRQIRKMVEEGTVIKVNGRTVRAENLTSAKFTIRWNVFKLDNTDGWHVDGVLVAKTGSLKVTKTFAGDAEAIAAVQQGYSIDVKYVPNEYTPANTGGTLSLTGDNVQYDAATNTYTWVLPVDQYRDYTVTEKNYQSDRSGIVTNAQYSISRSVFQGQNTDGWQLYTGRLTVTGQTLAAGEQTVSLLNIYTQTGVMTLEKVDALTGVFLPGVSFTVRGEEGQPLRLYDLGENHYTVDPQQGCSVVDGGQITTDAKGQAFLYLGVGTFTFTETVPQGYEDPGTITVTLGVDGTINQASAANNKADREFTHYNGTTLRVRNYSKVLPLTVEKFWADGENKPVVLQVFCEGQNMGTDFAVTLNGISDHWYHTYSLTVPMYINGQPARYTLREMQIGSWSYSEEYGGDGYRYYDVSYSEMQYRTTGGQPTDLEGAGEIYLSVTNQRTQVTTVIRKVDQDGVALPDGEFYLYNAPSGEVPAVTVTKDDQGNNILQDMTPVMTAISDTYGWIDLGLLPGGNYYLIEHQAPPGYLGTDDLYLLEVQGTGVTLKRWADGQWVVVPEKTIANQKNTVEVHIKKLVTGNFGDQSRSFQFTVNSDKTIYPGTGYTVSQDGKAASFRLSHGEDVVLIAEKGATLTIGESDAEGYTMTIQVEGKPVEGSAYIVPSDDTEMVDIIVVNTRNTIPDAGVVLDTLPYVLILVLAAGASLLLRQRNRRSERE